jgi:two-component system response regulator FixJ
MSIDAVVHVVDDDVAVRQSLSFLLASDGFPVRLYESASAFLDAVQDASGGCIVTDVRMPGIDGIDFMRRLRMRGNTLPVIVITGHADVALAVEAMKEGASDFVEKPFDDEVLLSSIRAALSGQAERVQARARSLEAKARIEALSDREIQVLNGLVAGKPNKNIAFDLNISPRTVEIYRSNLMMKMQAKSLSDLVRMTLLAQALGDPATGPKGKT